jgi:AcrR family transcriptional regulator
MSERSDRYGDPDTRSRILAATRSLLAEHGSALRLADVARSAGVSRQALYLHFGDRTGLLLALVEHMDQELALGASLAHVHEAASGAELLERAMRLNTEFWRAVQPIASVLAAAQDLDEALGAAWRDRMALRRSSFEAMIEDLAERGELASGWEVADAAALLYGVTHFDTWRELTRRIGWSDDAYVGHMSKMLRLTLLEHA